MKREIIPTADAVKLLGADALPHIRLLQAKLKKANAEIAAQRLAAAHNLFIDGEFQAHSGERLPFKIDCDALSDADIATLAAEIGRRFKFGSVHGVPRGGVRLANALIVHADPSVNRLLIVDDVLTTGRSMEEAKARFVGGDPIGVVIFARGRPCASWITPLFATPEAASLSAVALLEAREKILRVCSIALFENPPLKSAVREKLFRRIQELFASPPAQEK